MCPSKFYPDTSTQQCLGCDTSCAYCFDGTSSGCTSCTGALYLYNFTCTSSCPSGMNPNTYNVCSAPWVQTLWVAVALVLLLWL